MGRMDDEAAVELMAGAGEVLHGKTPQTKTNGSLR